MRCAIESWNDVKINVLEKLELYWSVIDEFELHFTAVITLLDYELEKALWFKPIFKCPIWHSLNYCKR